MKYYLDTNICIYFLKGMYPQLKEKILNLRTDEIKIPAIVQAELIYGAEKSKQEKKNKEIIRDFLFPFEIISFGKNEADEYGKIRAKLEKDGNIIGPNDLLIAATVLANQGILITNNVQEFARIKSLKIENWI